MQDFHLQYSLPTGRYDMTTLFELTIVLILTLALFGACGELLGDWQERSKN